MLFLKVGDYDEAYKEYSIFFKSGYFDFNNRARFTIMKEYIDCLRRGYDLENSTKILRRCYNENDVKDVINKVSNPSTILREIKILDFIDTDNYNNIMHTFNIIKKCVKGNPINQSAIKDYIRESIVV